jgi:phosphate transport system substrate-binding protein
MKHLGYAVKIILSQAVTLVLMCFAVAPGAITEEFGVAFCGAALVGLWVGRRCAAKYDLPDVCFKRYWPVLVLPTFFSVRAILGLSHLDIRDYSDIFFASLSPLCIISFLTAFILSSQKKKLANTKGLHTVRAAVFIVFVISIWQIKSVHDRYYEITLPPGYPGPTIVDDSELDVIDENYLENVLLPKLDFSPSLRLSEDLPKIDGATSFYPVYYALSKAIYQTGDKTLKDYVSLSRTEEAYNRLIRGEADLVFVLQPSDEQHQAARDAGVELRLTPIAREAFVFFVSEHNPVSGLSVEQIRNIYLKQITNWRKLGGNNEKILPFQRPNNSGSQTAMIKEVMKGKELPPPLQAEYSGTMGGTLRRIAAYRDYPGAIGYSFRFFAQKMVRYRDQELRRRFPKRTDTRVKFLAIEGVAPTEENIRNKSYPFTVDVFIATAGTKNPHVQELIDWTLSPEGQAWIEKVGYVGLEKRMDDKAH